MAARDLPQDGIRERWVVYLDHVREYDRTKKMATYGTDHIRQGRIAADQKEVEDRQKQGAVPGQITYVPYVQTVEAPVDQDAQTERRISYMEQLLEERYGPMYEYRSDTVRFDDIYGACANYLAASDGRRRGSRRCCRGT